MKLAELNRKPIWRSLYKAGADREKKFTAVLNCALAGDDWMTTETVAPLT
jgi:hypothetical protein